MATPVADRSSNKPENIKTAAEALGRSAQRRAVFKAIYTGKTKAKTVTELIEATGLDKFAVLHAGKALAADDVVHQVKKDKETAYEKVAFYQKYKAKILAASADPKKLAAIKTKHDHYGHAKAGTVSLTLKVPRAKVNAVRIDVDDCDSFKAVKAIPHGLPNVKMKEKKFKLGVAKILKQKGSFVDWGGELSDLSSTHLCINRKRRAAAFAFKGPGMTGKLVPGKMGKNGDQIQRLLRCPAEVFFVQYWNGIEDSVLDQLQQLIQFKSVQEGRRLWFGIIDGDDSARLIKAYPTKF
jgi:hypothetical protein